MQACTWHTATCAGIRKEGRREEAQAGRQSHRRRHASHAMAYAMPCMAVQHVLCTCMHTGSEAYSRQAWHVAAFYHIYIYMHIAAKA